MKLELSIAELRELLYKNENMDKVDVNMYEDIKEEDFAVDIPKAQILFVINQDNNIGIEFQWDGEDGTSEAIGTLLFDMNSGGLSELISNILINQTLEQPHSKEFIQEIVLQWKKCLKDKKNVLDSPAVHALKTFGASRGQN